MRSHCKQNVIRVTLFLINLLAAAQPMQNWDADRTSAIEIEGYHVSRYLLLKYFDTYARTAKGLNGGKITKNETDDWVRTFVAQQVIIAHLWKLGYNGRPGVMMLVSVMERHMLSLIGSQFDRSTEAEADTDMRELFHHSQILSDLTVVLFQDEACAVRELGTDFDKISPDDQSRVVHRSKGKDGVMIFEGRRTWPFSPFLDVADEIVRMPIGRWTKVHAHGAPQVYYIFVKNRAELPTSDFQTQEKEFSRLVDRVREDCTARRRRLRLLSSSGFILYPSAATQLLNKLPTLLIENSTIPLSGIADITTKALFSFDLGLGPTDITIETFCRDFNSRYFRTVPRDMGALRIAAEDMAVDEMNTRAAITAGIDRSPKFLEDRLGFTRLQILDAYEKESLLPQIVIRPDEVLSYYSKHVDQFKGAPPAATSAPSAVAEPVVRKMLVRRALNDAEVKLATQLQESSMLIIRFNSADLGCTYSQPAQCNIIDGKAYKEAISSVK